MRRITTAHGATDAWKCRRTIDFTIERDTLRSRRRAKKPTSFLVRDNCRVRARARGDYSRDRWVSSGKQWASSRSSLGATVSKCPFIGPYFTAPYSKPRSRNDPPRDSRRWTRAAPPPIGEGSMCRDITRRPLSSIVFVRPRQRILAKRNAHDGPRSAFDRCEAG